MSDIYDKLEHLKIELPTLKDTEGAVIRQGTIEGNYAVISINRPDRLNALTEQTTGEIATALRELELDSSVRAVVLRGTKEITKKPAFSAGADLGAAFGKGLNPSVAWHMGLAMRIRHRDYDELEQFSKPVIAAVDGFALGGGCELVLACDIVICTERSKLGLPEIHRGIIPANGGVTRMAARVGLGRALQICMLGEPLDGKTALDWGLANFCVKDGDEFENLVTKIATFFGQAATSALYVIKKCVKFGTRYPQLGLMMEQMGFGANTTSFDAKEGILAFNRKVKCTAPGCERGKLADGSKCPVCQGRRKVKDVPHFKGQ